MQVILWIGGVAIVAQSIIRFIEGTQQARRRMRTVLELLDG